MENFEFDDYAFEPSSIASPEQWDIYHIGDYGIANEIGYVHLRNGILSCYLNDAKRPIYCKNFAKSNKNSFKDDVEREHYFRNIVWSIKNYMAGCYQDEDNKNKDDFWLTPKKK